VQKTGGRRGELATQEEVDGAGGEAKSIKRDRSLSNTSYEDRIVAKGGEK